jgi:TonB-dependent SusC/RagA subfamily outer membrane receptor
MYTPSIITRGLDDINVDDIASFEIVKGASAAALYGSRAGNGVIVISTKRGQIGKTQVTFRSETGFNKITNPMDVNMSHGWTMADDWQNVQGQYTKLAGITYPAGFASVYAAGGPQATIGARSEDPDGYSDNPYGVYRDFQDEFFTEGITSTNYVSVSSGNENARSLFSFENTKNEGVVVMTDCNN